MNQHKGSYEITFLVVYFSLIGLCAAIGYGILRIALWFIGV